MQIPVATGEKVEIDNSAVTIQPVDRKKIKEIIVQHFMSDYICCSMVTANTFFGFYFSFFYFRMKPGMLLLKTK